MNNADNKAHCIYDTDKSDETCIDCEQEYPWCKMNFADGGRVCDSCLFERGEQE